MASLETASVALLATVKVKSEEKKEEVSILVCLLRNVYMYPQSQQGLIGTFVHSCRLSMLNLMSRLLIVCDALMNSFVCLALNV